MWQNEVFSGLELLSGRVQPNDLLGINDRLKNAAAVVNNWLKSPLKNLKIFIGAIFGRKKLRSSAKIFKKIIFDLFFKQVSLIFAASENQRSFWRFSKFSKKALKERKNQRTKTERNKFSSETILCCYFCPSEGLILKNLHIRNVYAADVKRIGIKQF